MAEPRRYPRYSKSCLTSLANGKGQHLSAYLVDVGWGGLGLRLRRRPYAEDMPVTAGEAVQLGVVDPAHGTLRVSGLVRWVRSNASHVRIGLELRHADPAFYGFVFASTPREDRDRAG